MKITIPRSAEIHCPKCRACRKVQGDKIEWAACLVRSFAYLPVKMTTGGYAWLRHYDKVVFTSTSQVSRVPDNSIFCHE